MLKSHEREFQAAAAKAKEYRSQEKQTGEHHDDDSEEQLAKQGKEQR